MGNEGSRLKGLVIDKNAVEANDFFILHDATTKPITTTTTPVNEEGRLGKLSIFQGEQSFANGQQIWGSQGPMKHAVKNLMIYRHPYILKYITTWEQGGETHLATERVRPLTAVLNTLSDIQICLGLRTVLCGLIFLTEKAMARHLNISISSIYITENGSWRLAGFEYVWKSNEVKKSLLESLQSYRCKSAVDPEELKTKDNIGTIEQYAFGKLCEEIFNKNKSTTTNTQLNDCDTPHVTEFREYCSMVLQHKKPELRPKLAAILLHPFFNHEFVLIHSFFFELPLKSMPEKQEFFTGLVDRLRYFNENVVAVQFSGDLLSRMVLLDPTAQLCVTPYVLKTKGIENTAALFSRDTYQSHVMPHIKRMFSFRDAQIRLILLEYFMEYARLLTEQELKEFILPHLLAGMNDTNDVLVAKTLRCLADLIPILGAAEVLGERMRLFADGRPQAAITSETTTHWVEPRSITPVLTSAGGGGGGINSDDDDVEFMVSGSPLPENIDLSGSFNSEVQLELVKFDCVTQSLENMPPRLSPDGGEDDKSVALVDGMLNAVEDDEIKTPLALHKDGNSFASSMLLPLTIDEGKFAHENEITANHVEVEEQWSDWEQDDELQNAAKDTNTTDINRHKPYDVSEAATLLTSNGGRPSKNDLNIIVDTKRNLSKHINDDLNALDIQIQKLATQSAPKTDEFDFFKDMEPVIKIAEGSHNTTTTTSNLPSTGKELESNNDEDIIVDASRFAALTQIHSSTNDDGAISVDGNGWDVEDDDDTVCLQANP